jgi:hypothetical protein
MKGAEYSKLFSTGQYGRLYIVSGSHARGNTFRIQILPDGEKAIPNGSQNLCLNKNAVEVYGVVSGNPGWTESYGWLHKGKWQEDFKKLVIDMEKFLKMRERQREKSIAKKEQEEKERVERLLNSY